MRSLWSVDLSSLTRLKALGYQQVGLADFETMAALEPFDRMARSVGLSPWLGITHRVVVPTGNVQWVRLYAVTPQGWSTLARACQHSGPWPLESVCERSLLVVVAGPRQEWWRAADNWNILTHAYQVVIERDGQDSWGPSDEIRGARWIPSGGIRYQHRDDQAAYQILTDIGGVEPEHSAGPVVPYGQWIQSVAQDAAGLFVAKAPGQVVPSYQVRLPELSSDDAAYLTRQVQEGLLKRYGAEIPDTVRERVQDELAVITDLGFASYFLIVADLIHEARRRNIRVGPGRGSAAGSLVSYAMGITDIDPLRYGLVFERFLNPARRNMPDIDMDFEDERRGELLTYLRDKWGRDRVAQIGTYGTFGARAVVRDVGRALGQPVERASSVLATVSLGPSERLADHRNELLSAVEAHHGPPPWVDLALALEGLPRHRSTHAAGVVIAPEALSRWLPCDADGDGHLITQVEMATVERMGFLKLDLLGLRTLTTIRRAEELVGISAIMPDQLEPEDPATLRLLARAETDGVFQLDGRGVKELLRQMHPTSMQEVMTVVALYRPGPMDQIGTFLARRQGRQSVPGDPISRLCQDTWGVLLYQEQLMEVVRHLADYSMAEADLFRRAISKKDHQWMAAEGERLQSRLKAHGFSGLEAQTMWNSIQSFADYGFNKAHAAAYGFLSYYMAYLKAHWPWAFWCAELSSVPSTDRLSEEMASACGQGFAFLPPHVNASDVGFTMDHDALRAGLDVIKGLGIGPAQAISQERQARGPYVNMEDFEQRIGSRLPRRAIDSMLAAGAFMGLRGLRNRQQLSLFDEEDQDEVLTEPILARDRFSMPWPVATGPVIIRADEDDEGNWSHRLRPIVEAFPGSVGVVVSKGRSGRGRPVTGVAIDGGWRAIEAIKQISQVRGIGRQVLRQDTLVGVEAGGRGTLS